MRCEFIANNHPCDWDATWRIETSNETLHVCEKDVTEFVNDPDTRITSMITGVEYK